MAEQTQTGGWLSTHVLDTARGVPAMGVLVSLYAVETNGMRLLKQTTTNADGRCDAPLLDHAEMHPGSYELTFDVGAYFRAAGTPLAYIPFLDVVPIRFGIADVTLHYHVPLLLQPYGYATYRGS